MLVFIHEFRETQGYCPNNREMGEAVEIPSTSVTSYYLDALKREGLVDFKPKSPRTVHLTEAGRLKVNEMLKVKTLPQKNIQKVIQEVSVA